MRPAAALAASLALSILLTPRSVLAEGPAPAPQSAPPAAPAPEPPRGPTSGARIYLGGAGAADDASASGTGAVLGFQSYSGRGGTLSSLWGIEILGVRLGTGFLPIITADFGLRFMPWPEGFLRPYVKGGIGVSLLIIIPIPSLHVSLGLGIPIGKELVIDVALTIRRAFNIFDVNKSLGIGSLELGVGF